MKKVVRLTESDLHRIIKRVITESEGGYGIMSKKTEMGEQDEMSGDGSFVSFLKGQGFKDWSGGNPGSYGMVFHYISRKPKTPANLSCSVGQEKGKKTVDINILFDSVIEKAERYENLTEFDKKSAIAKIERLSGKEFDWNKQNAPDAKFTLQLQEVPEDTAKEIIRLYNQIRMVGPYSK